MIVFETPFHSFTSLDTYAKTGEHDLPQAARPLREILGRHAAKLNMEDRQAVEAWRPWCFPGVCVWCDVEWKVEGGGRESLEQHNGNSLQEKQTHTHNCYSRVKIGSVKRRHLITSLCFTWFEHMCCMFYLSFY